MWKGVQIILNDDYIYGIDPYDWNAVCGSLDPELKKLKKKKHKRQNQRQVWCITLYCLVDNEPIPIDRRSKWYCSKECQINANHQFYILKDMRKNFLNVIRQAKMYNVYE